MSTCLHVWYAHPLPWDAESAQAHWQSTRASGVHEPRLVQCVQRLTELLADHDSDMVWSEAPEATEPCATLTLAPMGGSLALVTDAIVQAAAACGLCVFNPFDGSVWRPDGRMLTQLSLEPLPSSPPPQAAPTPSSATDPAATEALRGDAPLATYLLTQWAPLLRQAGFKVRTRPSSEHPWGVFTGKVLQVKLHGRVRHSELIISVSVSPGGTTMPPALQTEFGVGSLWVDLVALARMGALPAEPQERSTGYVGHDYFTHLSHVGGDPARLAAQWLNLFRVMVNWLKPLDNIQALALAFNDQASPFRWLSTHPIEGMMLNCHVREVTKLLAGQPGAELAVYRHLALIEGMGMSSLRDMLAGLQMPLDDVRNGVQELVVWQGQADAADPLRELAQLRNGPPGPVPEQLQWLLEFVNAAYPCAAQPDKPGFWATPPAETARQPWLTLAFAIDETGKLRNATPAQSWAHTQLRRKALNLGLTVYSPQNRCVWTPDDGLHTPFGTTSLRPPAPPPLQTGRSLNQVQAFCGVQTALAPLLAGCGFRKGLLSDLFVKANAIGVWTVSAHTLGDDGLLFCFEPHHRPAQGDPFRRFTAKNALVLLGRLRGHAAPECPAAVQLATSNPQRFELALDRLRALLTMGVLDLLHWLDDPAHCQAWVQSTNQ